MDGTRIEARRRKRQIQRKKQARLRKVLVIMLVIMAAVTAAIGTWSYFRTNVYQDDEEFQAYAEEQIKDNQIFKVGNVVVKTVFADTDVTLDDRLEHYLRNK